MRRMRGTRPRCFLGGQHLAQAAPGRLGRRGDGQAGVGAGVGGERAGAAAGGHDGDRSARRDRLGGHQHGGVEQFAEAGGGDDAGLLEQRLPPSAAKQEIPMPSRQNCSSSAAPTPPDWTARPT